VAFGVDGDYQPLETGSEHAVAFVRGGDVAVVATRLPVGLQRAGWRDAAVELPEGPWRDLLSAAELPGGSTPLGRLLEHLPVALLVRG
jgi:(1->4)-alpha-D-glucan 1-alpha-D-glucosylmutase